MRVTILTAVNIWYFTFTPPKMKKVSFATVLWLIYSPLFRAYGIIWGAMTNQVFLHRFGFWHILYLFVKEYFLILCQQDTCFAVLLFCCTS